MINPCKHDTDGDGTHEAELQTFPQDRWEIVEVWVNSIVDDPKEEEALAVSVHGVRETQWRDCFVWGQFISPLR